MTTKNMTKEEAKTMYETGTKHQKCIAAGMLRHMGMTETEVATFLGIGAKDLRESLA